MTTLPPAADVKSHVQRQFADVAANYRNSRVHATGADLDWLVAAADPQADMLALDAGCGAGHTALALAGRAGAVFACDFTRAMLDQVAALACERGVDNLALQQADVERLPYPAARFDIVATRYSAHHWQQPEQALAEFRRVLKPTGVFAISDIMADEGYAQDTFLQAIELLRDPSHVRDFRASEWLTMLRAAGFVVAALERFSLSLHFATWTQRMRTPRSNRALIKSLFAGASADIRRGFGLPAQINDDNFSFTIPGAVILARPADP
ncbi:MAG: methyltransferase domain-containing protein [Chloroflexi bacterium]|nr:methyltransferase domain-containing protein [Chloroflexota bacterium]MCY4248679.1 methyltransferase domain-containing protein [Chloroflexota bacterium]